MGQVEDTKKPDIASKADIEDMQASEKLREEKLLKAWEQSELAEELKQACAVAKQSKGFEASMFDSTGGASWWTQYSILTQRAFYQVSVVMAFLILCMLSIYVFNYLSNRIYLIMGIHSYV